MLVRRACLLIAVVTALLSLSAYRNSWAQNGRWCQIQSSGPSARFSPAGCYDSQGDRMIVFGGEDANGLKNDVWVLTLGTTPTWSQLTTSGGPPAPRKEHRIIYDPDSNRVVLFGGEGETFHGSAEVDTIFGDVWCLSLGDSTWTKRTGTGTPACRREGHTAVYDPTGNRMAIFGGEVATSSGPGVGYTSSTFFLDFDNWSWGNHSCPDEGPECYVVNGDPCRPLSSWPVTRWYSAAIWDSASARMLMHGGEYIDGPDNETWKLEASGWTKLTPTNSPRRTNHRAVHDPIHGRMLMFGGEDGSDLSSDAYALGLPSASAWTLLSPSGTAPSARNYFAAAFDLGDDRMIVFGGTGVSGKLGDTWQLSFDSTAPATTTSLALSYLDACNKVLRIRWTAPGDDNTSGRASSYSVRKRLGSAITDGNWDSSTDVSGAPVPSTAGALDSITVSGLSGGTWYFAIRTTDEACNTSGVSNDVNVTFDDAPPATTSDLNVVSSSGGNVKFKWTAPGDDGTGGSSATSYVLRKRANAEITGANWSTSTVVTATPSGPSTPGATDSITIGLNADTTWYVALKTTDNECNTSSVSNSPCIKLGTDTTAPATTSDLEIASISGGVKYKWTAPGDDGSSGCEAASYEIRKRSGSEITAENWPYSTLVSSPLPSGPTKPATGVKDSITISLSSGVYWYVAVKTKDLAGNVSGVSNNACIKLGNPPDYCGGGLSARPSREESSPARELAIVDLRPNPTSEGGALVSFSLAAGAPAKLQVFDVAGRLIEAHDLALLGPGAHEMRIGGRTRLSPGHYRVRISQGGLSAARSVIVVR